jgi:hypothetical protein
VAEWGGVPPRWRIDATLDDDPARVWSKRTDLEARLLAEECELCGSRVAVEVHHMRALKDLWRRGYCREHRRAVEAVASLPGERLRAAPSAQPAPSASPPAAQAAEPTGALPVYLSSFVGREADSAEVVALLAGARLPTLAGADG